MELNDTKLQVLNEHYAQTYEFLYSHLKKRDRLFAAVLALLFAMLFQLYTPQDASFLISKLISTKLGLKETINFLYIQSVIWFLLLAIVIKYFQAVVYIERQYGYIHSLEKLLSKPYEDGAFTREGVSYQKDYPAFLNWASFLYTILFPSILIIVSFSKIISEFNDHGFDEVLVWFNGVIFLFTIFSIVLYLIMIHFKGGQDNKGEDSNEQTES